MNTHRSRPATAPRATPPQPGADGRGQWYRQPVLWLAAVLFATSLAACVLMIVLGARHADEPLPTAGGTSFKVPLARPATPPDPPGNPR